MLRRLGFVNIFFFFILEFLVGFVFYESKVSQNPGCKQHCAGLPFENINKILGAKVLINQTRTSAMYPI